MCVEYDSGINRDTSNYVKYAVNYIISYPKYINILKNTLTQPQTNPNPTHTSRELGMAVATHRVDRLQSDAIRSHQFPKRIERDVVPGLQHTRF